MTPLVIFVSWGSGDVAPTGAEDDAAATPPSGRRHAPNPPRSAEARKILLIGGSTYAVSLPKQWVQLLGLQAGDTVRLEARADGSVVVVPPRERGSLPTRQRIIDVTSQDADELLRTLIALYVSGTDVIVLRTKSGLTDALRAAVDEARDRLLGLQVVDENASTITLQDLADPQEFNMHNGLRLMHYNARRMLEEVAGSLAAQRPTAPLPVDLMRCEAELDRLLLLILKQHNRFLRDLRFSAATGLQPEESLHHVLVAQYLERVGDYALRLAEATRAPGNAHLASQLHAATTLAIKCVDDSVTAFFRRSARLANATIGLSQRLSELSRATPRDAMLASGPTPLGCDECLGLAHAFECLDRIGRYAKSISEVAFNQAFALTRADPPRKPSP